MKSSDIIKCLICWKSMESRNWVRKHCVKCSNMLHKQRAKIFTLNRKLKKDVK